MSATESWRTDVKPTSEGSASDELDPIEENRRADEEGIQ
jgi:hypothetical protein